MSSLGALFRRKSTPTKKVNKDAQAAIKQTESSSSHANGTDNDAPPPPAQPLERTKSKSKNKPPSSVTDSSLPPTHPPRPPCPCLAAARSWLTSPANSLHLQLFEEKLYEEEWIIHCPTLGTPAAPISFTLTLSLPHGLNVSEEGSILEDLEAEAYDFLFGDSERVKHTPNGDHEGCTMTEILTFAHQWIRNLDSAWNDELPAVASPARKQAQATSPAHKQTSPHEKKTDDGEDDDAMEEDGFDEEKGGDGDDGFGDDDGFGGDDGDGDWGEADAIDMCEMNVDEPASKPVVTKHSHGIGIGDSSASGVQVFTRDEVVAYQSELIPRVAQTLCITPSAAIILLRSVKWQEEVCLARYKTDGAKFVQETHCGAILREYVQPPANSQSVITCGVCYDDEVPAVDSFAMSCGHRFCLGCWKFYLTAELEGGTIGGANALTTKCMGEKCPEILGLEAVELILAHAETPEDEAKNKKLLERYERMLQLSFVDDNNYLNWCPASGCTMVLQNYSKLHTVKCTCGCQFCFTCKLEAHAPCSCKEAADWILRDKGSSNLDMKFLLEQTKPCPNCGVRTKKEGGCMFLTCAQCKKSWCWHCGQSGDDHHVWECNRPQYESTDKTSELNRYLFYYERHYNHKQSTLVAGKQITATQEKMSQLVDNGMHFKQVEFLLSATQLVFQCRRVLSWSYARAFFITDKHAKTLFEYRQSELEQYTEKLNQMTEGSLEKLSADRLLVLDWTRALGKYLSNMEIDEDVSEKAIPAGAITTKIEKPTSPATDATTPTASTTSSTTTAVPAKTG